MGRSPLSSRSDTRAAARVHLLLSASNYARAVVFALRAICRTAVRPRETLCVALALIRCRWLLPETRFPRCALPAIQFPICSALRAVVYCFQLSDVSLTSPLSVCTTCGRFPLPAVCCASRLSASHAPRIASFCPLRASLLSAPHYARALSTSSCPMPHSPARLLFYYMLSRSAPRCLLRIPLAAIHFLLFRCPLPADRVASCPPRHVFFCTAFTPARGFAPRSLLSVGRCLLRGPLRALPTSVGRFPPSAPACYLLPTTRVRFLVPAV